MDADIARDLQQLTADLKQLEAEYNMFFAGRLPRPPWETRSRVDALIRRWDRKRIDSSVDRFRFQSLQARYATFVDLWDRGQRAREEGRPGPFAAPPGARHRPRKQDEAPATRVLHVTAFKDPAREADKLSALYESLNEARRQAGQEVVPLQRFEAVVKAQIGKFLHAGSPEVAFRVAVQDGRVTLTVRGLKERGK